MTKAFQFPVYQIDFSAVASGKHFAASKRRIRWRFGFPNRQALDAGRTGTDCRGEEHEIVITWSITSGKRQIIMDGKEIHYASSRTSVLDHSWSTKGNHVLKVVCHAAAPLTATPGFRQYDMFIDGQSFFTMPKVYELGIRGIADRAPVQGGAGASYAFADAGRQPYAYPSSQSADPAPAIRAPRSPSEEDAELQRAINESLQESRQHLEHRNGGPETSGALPASAGGGEPDNLMDSDTGGTTDLLGFDSEPPPMPPQQQLAGSYMPTTSYGDSSISSYQQQPQQSSYLALPAHPGQGMPGAPGAPVPPAQHYQQYGAPPPGPGAYGAPPPPASYPDANFTASGGYEDPYAPKPPTHNTIANEILSAYGSTAASSPPGNMAGGGGYETPNYGQPLALEHDPQSQQQNGVGGGLMTLSMNVLATTEAEEEEPTNAVEAAMRKLVNIDHIDQPAEEKMKLTMKKEEDVKAKKLKGKSTPLPPVAAKLVGTGATLSQIQEIKPHEPSQPKEGIMNAPPVQLFNPNAHMAGAMVMYGQGPPPLQPQGFGVGYSQPGYAQPGFAQPGYAQPGYYYPPQGPPPPQQQAYQYR